MNANDLRNELRALLNRASRENESNTPDFILAGYLMNCLEAFEDATRQREGFSTAKGFCVSITAADPRECDHNWGVAGTCGGRVCLKCNAMWMSDGSILWPDGLVSRKTQEGRTQ